MERFEQFFSSNFMMPHGYCFLWLPEIVWLHVVADLLIATAYFSIPLALWVFAKKRPDMPFRPLFLMFASFITLCGLTHLFGIMVLWYPYYGVEGLVKLATGAVSALTAVVIWRILPSAIKLPSPKQLQQMNADLQDAYALVENRVKQRTKELADANKELASARRRAEAASDAKSEFLANISHEIRTPMNAVVLLSERLAHSNLPGEKERQYAETLSDSAKALMSLLNDVLDFSKIEAHSMELEHIRFDLMDILNESIGIMRIKAEEKKIGIELSHKASLPNTYVGDPTRIRQVLLNLINNAIKFTDDGQISVSVDGKQKSADIYYISIAVQDTGVGIDNAKLEELFKKFTQADSSITRQYGGTGLGLAISKELIEQMGGHIDVVSTVGEGTCFTIQLPLKQAASDDTTTQDDAAQKASSQKTTDNHVLLVEDTDANILVASLLLDDFGYSYDIAKTGKEALDLLKGQRYNAILMDLRLPDMEGYRITEQFRAWEKENNLKQTPIIAMTAYATQKEKERSFTSGMNDFITKPIDRDMLEELLSLHTTRK